MAAKSRGGGGRRTEEEVLSLLEAAQDILEREREQQPKGQLTMQAEIRSVTVLHQKHLLVLFTLYNVQYSYQCWGQCCGAVPFWPGSS